VRIIITFAICTGESVNMYTNIISSAV